jgi:hypothetical protein
VASNPPTLEIGQAYALRAWIMWLQSQISQAQPELQRQIGEHQREIARLRASIERSSSVLTSLRATIAQLDDMLRGVQDTDIVAGTRVVSGREQRPLSRATGPVPRDRAAPRHDAPARN